jgi:hypothetical protein
MHKGKLQTFRCSNRVLMMRSSRIRLVAAVAVLGACASGCTSLYTESATTGAGIAGAALAAKVTNNAAVATGIGLGMVAAAKAGVQYTERVVHTETQDAIATAAGPLRPGAVANWRVSHVMPIEDNQQGRVTVSRTISTGKLDCKEIVFSVDTAAANSAAPTASGFYVAAICRDNKAWKWASAEPATERWGALQ